MMTQEYVRQFFNDPDNHSGVWLNHLQGYVSIPNKVKDTQAFVALDAWYYTLDVSRGYITKDELVNIMKWKLMRGKMRPLLGKIEALAEEDVQAATYNGINLLRQAVDDAHVRAALDAVGKPLKGVGPATASAVLAKWNTAIPFMSDAGLIAVNGNTDYTLAAYIKYYHGISLKVGQLNNDGKSSCIWTAREVEAVLHILYSRYDLKVGQ